MSNEQKISLELAIKLWGGVITALLSVLSVLIGVLLYIYTENRNTQQKFNDEASTFIRKQSVMNNVIFDMISDYHPDSRDKIIQYINRYESTNTRSVK